MLQSTLFDTFKSYPSFFFWSAVAAAFGLAFILLGAIRLSKNPKSSVVLGVLAVAAGLAAVGWSAVGSHAVQRLTDEVSSEPGLDVPVVARMRADGKRQAAYVLDFGLASAALPLLAGSLILVIGSKRLRRVARQ